MAEIVDDSYGANEGGVDATYRPCNPYWEITKNWTPIEDPEFVKATRISHYLITDNGNGKYTLGVRTTESDERYVFTLGGGKETNPLTAEKKGEHFLQFESAVSPKVVGTKRDT